ncbi:putative chaperone protein [Rosellinia necatrix]|uniref:Putative chaperone protein n=1 Tax=Rosellinia necatrix TaxID=77044 RepID=A0A1S7UJT9_ROSNE|nr:putative chaperone protein [Rosellinia necatrix]
MSNNAISLVGWMFLPNLVTGWVQSIYYGLTVRAGEPRPAPNSARWHKHRRRIHALVVVLYLLYTVYEADWELRRAGSYYESLGVPFDATERAIKSRFRRLAALHHPDKVSHATTSATSSSSPNDVSGGGGGGGGAEDFFIHLKTASDVLTDPARRFAYERFGPDITSWRHCVTARDFVWRGLQTQVIPHYGLAAAGLYGLGLLGYLEFGRYWRWVTLLALCVFEAHTVMRPRFPPFVDVLVNPLLVRLTSHPPYLPFQVVALARRVAVAVYIAFGQLGPVLHAAAAASREAAAGEAALRQGLDRLEGAVRLMDADTARLMELEMAPFAGDPDAVDGMRAKLREWLVQNTIRADPLVRDALGRSLQKRRVDAPPGARGTK